MSEKVATISPENKIIAQYVARAFGGTPRVGGYADKANELTVDILSCSDRPRDGVTSFSTIGLSDHPMSWGNGEFPTRLELAGVCVSNAESFPNILASAAFEIMRSDAVYHPGTVMSNCVSQYYPSSNLPHLYLTAPFLWNDELRTLDCGTKKVSWLLAMPISDTEYSYLKEHDFKTFERMLESHQIDIADLGRCEGV